MALSEGLKSVVDFLTKGFREDEYDEEEAFTGFTSDGGLMTDGNAALKSSLDTMYSNSDYGTRIKPERSFEREAKVVSHPNSYKSGEVTVIEPRSFSESAQIVKKLIDKKTVILHLDLLDKEQSQRTIDFVCGAAHALDGTAQKISDMVVIFTPSNVSLSVENSATQSKFAEALWNKPL